jgi:hypothetical protein
MMDYDCNAITKIAGLLRVSPAMPGLLSSVNLRLLRYARNDVGGLLAGDECGAINPVIARVVAMGIAGETRSNLTNL